MPKPSVMPATRATRCRNEAWPEYISWLATEPNCCATFMTPCAPIATTTRFWSCKQKKSDDLVALARRQVGSQPDHGHPPQPSPPPAAHPVNPHPFPHTPP